MLKLVVKELDVVKVSKIIVKHDVEAVISNQSIILDGNVSESLLDELCSKIDVLVAQNVQDDKGLNVVTNDFTFDDLKFPKVKRGEVYFCEFGVPFGSEMGKYRPALIVQNDVGNEHSKTTIVIPFTTSEKGNYPFHYELCFDPNNMLDYDDEYDLTVKSTALAEQIRVVDKRRLRKYIGCMRPEFMEKMQNIIDAALGLNRCCNYIITKKEEIVEKKEETKKDIEAEKTPQSQETVNLLDLNIVQIELLSLVNIQSLLKIYRSSTSNEILIKRILNLFGFDMNKKGMDYLFEAIMIAPKNKRYNFENLCQNVYLKTNKDNVDEIKRLIVARVKETLKFKKSPTIDFIRLVNTFTNKKEESGSEEDNI